MCADDDFCYDPNWLHPDLVTNVNSSFWIYVEGSRATNLLDLEYFDDDKLDEIWEYDSGELACQVRIIL